MQLRKASATYGKLNGDTLFFQDGFHLIYAPNESGKSTWVSFLLSMLYGLPTRSRSQEADKNKYTPWNGTPMAGILTVETEGQIIDIIRTTQRPNAPMGQFSACYAETATPYQGLTIDTCGEQLLGVPREIYERTGVIREIGLSIQQTPELQKRITGLMTTGEETISFTEVQTRLKKALHSRQYHKSGTIPTLEEQIFSLDQEITAAKELKNRVQQLEAALDTYEPPVPQQAKRRMLPWLLTAIPVILAMISLLFHQPIISLICGVLALSLGAVTLRRPAPQQATVPDTDREELQKELHYAMGQLDAKESLDTLLLRKEQLQERLTTAQREYGAIALAMETLQESYTEISNRFSPALSKLTESFFTKLTNEKYNKVLLHRDLIPSAGETTFPRPLHQLSKGTQDQLYLALRLGLTQLLLPKDTPLILDDSLVHFDDSRMEAALELLLELSKERQILYFTCQKREEQYLKQQHPNQYHKITLV